MGDVRPHRRDVRLAAVVPVAMDPDDASARVIAILGEPAAREFLLLERPDQDRAALIGRLHGGDDRQRQVAELLMDLEDDVGEIVRLRRLRRFGTACRVPDPPVDDAA